MTQSALPAERYRLWWYRRPRAGRMQIDPAYESARGQGDPSTLLLEADALRQLAARLRKFRAHLTAQRPDLTRDQISDLMRQGIYRDFRDPLVYGPSDRRREEYLSRNPLDKLIPVRRLDPPVRTLPKPDDIIVETAP